MSPQKNQSDNDNEILDEIHRWGAPIIKTSIEIEKDLYLKMKEKVVQSNSSIRDFLTNAVRAKLIQEEQPQDKLTRDVNTIEWVIENNTFLKKVLDTLRQEVRPPFNLGLLMAKLEECDISPVEFAPSDLSDNLIEKLVKPVNALSGPVVAKELKDALVRIRRE
jgi:hypothetical protein